VGNPTKAVAAVSNDYQALGKYWPTDPAKTADSFYPMEMIGMNGADGYANHFDDSQSQALIGLHNSKQKLFQSDTPAADFYLHLWQPRRFSMPLASGTAGRPAQIGLPAYATNSGAVQTTTGGLTFGNLAGVITDIYQDPFSTMTGALNVMIAPAEPVAASYFVCAVPASAPAAGAGTGTAGVGIPMTAGAGGGTATGTGGAGGAVTITAGAGGTATGAGTGGAGGTINLVPGAGGGTTGGTAGVSGEVQFNGSSDGIETAGWLQAQGAAPTAGSFTVFLATRAYRVKSFKASFATASTSGTVTTTKDTGTAAPGAGTALLTGTVSLAGTANTVVSGTLVATDATLKLAAGDRLALTLAGTLTNLAGAFVQIGLTPI
jgi:hypothetical protein